MKIQRSAILLLLFLSLLVNGQETSTNQPVSAAKIETFEFEGGRVRRFVEAINQYFKIDLFSFAEIPEGMQWGVHVPKMRVARPANFIAVLHLYNSVSEENPELGMWVIKGEEVGGKPGAVALIRSRSSKDARTINVRAFSCKGLDRSKVESLMQEISTSNHEVFRIAEQKGVDLNQLDGNISYHTETGILLATGGDLYIKLVEELLQAFKEQAQEFATKDAKADRK